MGRLHAPTLSAVLLATLLAAVVQCKIHHVVLDKDDRTLVPLTEAFGFGGGHGGGLCLCACVEMSPHCQRHQVRSAHLAPVLAAPRDACTFAAHTGMRARADLYAGVNAPHTRHACMRTRMQCMQHKHANVHAHPHARTHRNTRAHTPTCTECMPAHTHKHARTHMCAHA